MGAATAACNAEAVSEASDIVTTRRGTPVPFLARKAATRHRVEQYRRGYGVGRWFALGRAAGSG